MLYADNIIERSGVILKNLNINSNTLGNNWSTPSSSYGFYTANYETPLIRNHYYYYGCTYKYTTTNQRPTWVTFYRQTGNVGGNSVSNPTPGTEYKITTLAKIEPNSVYSTTGYGTVYNGPSNAISGVSSQVKNVFMYDVTELYMALLGQGTVTNDTTFKTWCDNNITYTMNKNLLDLSSKISTSEKTTIKNGYVTSNQYVETEGMNFYSINSTIRNNTYFDTGIPFGVYNNSGGGTVTHTRVSASSENSPFQYKHPYIVKITTDGTASPGAGGFVATHTSAANKIFIERFVAKVPVGYTVTSAYNSQGTGSSVTYLTPRAGTGDWAEYAILYKCGSSGTFSTGGHVYISGSNNTSVTWYVAYVNNCDITGKEYLKDFTVLDKLLFKKGNNFARKFDTVNILPNGDCGKQESSMLPNGWQYDTTDYAGDAHCSLVQPVGAATATFGDFLEINPNHRYKISYWVKCKQDMSSFLTAIIPYAGNTELGHTSVVYVPGTKTTLTAQLKSGDTQVQVSNNANWVAKNYSKLGFRNYMYSYNNLGTSNSYTDSSGLIAGKTGTNIINLKIPYSGTTQNVGTYVVESYDGGTYPYPIQKSNLPTNNTWKYVEGYFGGTTAGWDGSSASGWTALPSNANRIKVRLNLYTNNGTVPIKYSDIKIQPVSAGCGNRFENKLQIKEGTT